VPWIQGIHSLPRTMLPLKGGTWVAKNPKGNSPGLPSPQAQTECSINVEML